MAWCFSTRASVATVLKIKKSSHSTDYAPMRFLVYKGQDGDNYQSIAFCVSCNPLWARVNGGKLHFLMVIDSPKYGKLPAMSAVQGDCEIVYFSCHNTMNADLFIDE